MAKYQPLVNDWRINGSFIRRSRDSGQRVESLESNRGRNRTRDATSDKSQPSANVGQGTLTLIDNSGEISTRPAS